MIGEAKPRFAVSRMDGTPIYYDIVEPLLGLDDGVQSDHPTVVMSDGIGCDGYVWKHLRRALARSYRLIHWHYPGHGRSPKPKDPQRLSIAGLASDLCCVLDDAGVSAAIACGHSMGVQVTLEAYRRSPERISAQILACGSPENPLKTFRGTDLFESFLPTVTSLVERTPWLFNRISRKLLPTRLAYEIATLLEANEALLDQNDFMPYLEGMARVDIRLFLAMLRGARAHSAVDLLPSVRIPTLIIGGTYDTFTPPALSARMHSSIPDSELFMVENGTHTAPIERPDEVNRAVLDFLRRRVAVADPATTAAAT